MADELVSGLLKDSDLRVVLATAGEVARRARSLQQAEPAAAVLLGQGLCAGALLAALQKERSRVNLQLECDGPLRGLFVDAEAGGIVRGYLKNPHVQFVGAEGEYQWRPVLGNKGFLSVLRDLGDGEYYRSSVELTRFHLAEDLERYFSISEQLETQVQLETLPSGGEPLGSVAGLLIQPLPDGDREALRRLGADLRSDGAFRKALEAHGDEGAPAVLRALFPQPDLEVMSRYPLTFQCTCSRERVKRALLAMGREELADVLAKEGKAEATCQFCTTHYEVSREELEALLAGASI